MRPDIDPDVCFSEVFQLRDELNELGEVFFNERLTAIILDALPEEMYSTIEVQSIRDSDLGLEDITTMTKTIFINHSERSPVPKRSQDSCRRSRDNSGRQPTMSGRQSAMADGTTCHNRKTSGHKKKHCNLFNKKSDGPSNVKNGTSKWCSYHHSDGYSHEDCYQQ